MVTAGKTNRNKHSLPARYRPQRKIWLVLLSVHIALGLLFVLDRSPGTDAALSGFPLDDTWIHMVYARNLAQYGLPYYNHGILESGFTSPLWMIFGALAHIIAFSSGASAVVIIKMLGVLLAWLTSVAIFELCRYFTDHLASAVLCGLYVATMPVIAFSQVSGMEVCLASCLGGWAILCLFKNRFFSSGILLGLGAIARPENVILTMLVVVSALLWGAPKSHPTKLNRVLRLLLPTAVFLLLWSLMCLLITGHPMPNTYYAKFSSSDVMGGFSRIIGEVVLKIPAMFLFSGILFYVGGVLYMLKTRSWQMTLPVIVYPWLFILAIATSRNMPLHSGLYYYWLRYVVPALPFIFIPVGAGFELFWSPTKWSPRLGSKTSMVRLARLMTVLLVIISWIKLPGQLRFRSSQFAWNCQNINEVQVELGRWVNEHTPPDAAIVVNDAGALRYFGGRKTIDLLGLNDHALLFNPQLRDELSWNTAAMVKFLKSENASYLIIFPSWYVPLVWAEQFKDNFKLVYYRQSKNYTICAAPQDFMAVYLYEH
jgi:hypothetical protein